MKKSAIWLLPILALLAAGCSKTGSSPDLKLNDLEYFERQGVNVLVFNNTFSGGFNDEKNSGIEIIHHGVRTVQGGAIRLVNTPEQWDLVPNTVSREVNTEDNSVEVALRYEDYDFDSRIVVTGKGPAVEIAVYLDKPVPKELEGDAGLNLEFLPSQYWGKTYLMDGRLNRFPRYSASETVARPNSEKVKQYKGYKTYDDRGTGEFVDPLPMETGHTIVMAPDEPERMIKVTSDSEFSLYDGRILAQNGWFVLRTVLPAGQTGKVVSWTVEPNAIKDWIREPNVGYSQVGYQPGQPKVAVIELDKLDKPQATAAIWQINEDGSEKQVFSGKVAEWGPYYKYNYVKFDFSDVKDPGIYYIKYGDVRTGNFLIDDSVYDKITDATSDVWIPIHMNHMPLRPAQSGRHRHQVQGPPADSGPERRRLLRRRRLRHRDRLQHQRGAEPRDPLGGLQAHARRDLRERGSALRGPPPSRRHPRCHPVHHPRHPQPRGPGGEHRTHVPDPVQLRA